jgi:hypothetical protein
MKARSFLAVVLALGLLALSLGAVGWWLVWQRGPLGLQHHPLSLPRAARFVPRQAPLSLYVLSDGEQPVAYARAVAPARSRRQAAEAIERLRDGAFAAAGLDYRNELAAWLAPDIGLALFDLPDAGSAGSMVRSDQDNGHWLLALRSRDGDGARRFVQRFWQTRSLAGTDLQVSSYRGMGLISGRGALLGRPSVPLATALVDDDLLLIASGRGVLEQALDVSQVDELNQAADPALQQRLAGLGDGVALLVAHAQGFGAGLGLPTDAAAGAQLLASVRPDGPSLRVEALLQRPGDGDQATAALPMAERRSLLAIAPGSSDRLGLLHDPAGLLGDPLLRPLVERVAALMPGAGPLPPLLVAAADGPLLVAEGPAGWLMATPADHPTPQALEAPLAAAGLIPAPLEVEGRAVTVWTRLEADRSARQDRSGVDRLQAPLEAWRSDLDGIALWGRSLALLEGAGGARGAQRRERQLEGLEAGSAPIQWSLAAAPARDLLRQWLPWKRLATLAGGPLDGELRGLAVALEPAADGLRMRGWLDYGAAA